jgi:DNA polymerase-3 subunit delta
LTAGLPALYSHPVKLQFKQIEAFVKKPDPRARAILIYGPDDGLIRERAAMIGKTIVADLNDPFNAVTLEGDALAADPARLMDEALAMSMLGGARLIRIRGGGDKLALLLKDYLKEPSEQNLVIVEAGELGPRSPLRILCEKAENAAALPCYVEDERSLAGFIRDTLRAANLSADADAVAFLAANLTGDRMRARSEIEKLITYMGAAAKHVTLADAEACCGGNGAQTLDKLTYGLGSGRTDDMLKTYALLLQEGTPVIAILRTLQSHVRRLHFVRSRMDKGEELGEIMGGLQPKIFFKFEPDFRMQANKWSLAALEKIMERLSNLEADSKKTGTPAETLGAQALLALSRGRG